MHIGEPICVISAEDRCGESPVWHAAQQCLYWTDINRCVIRRFDPAQGSVKSWSFEEPVTALALTSSDDTLLVALSSRLILWNPLTGERRDHGFGLPGWPAVRFNDGAPDPRGSFWIGSMRNNIRPDGSAGETGGTDGILFRADPDGRVTEWQHDVGICNTVAWSPDHARFYFADSLANRISVFHYDRMTGAISEPRPFLAGFPRGLPDGSAVDSEGFLWNCRYGGASIVRVAPDGTVDRVIEMPAVNITNCTFGGPDLRTLYVTSAALGAPPEDRLAGSVFAVSTDVAGQRENRFLVKGGLP
jgi:sugar lactone lactonase YvrE